LASDIGTSMPAPSSSGISAAVAPRLDALDVVEVHRDALPAHLHQDGQHPGLEVEDLLQVVALDLTLLQT
jgi:hypothetical protein